MKNLYKVNTYEYYILVLYIYMYDKYDNIDNSLNKKIMNHYIKLFNIIYNKKLNVKELLSINCNIDNS